MKNKAFIILMFLTSISVSSCKKFVEVDAPKNLVIASSVFKNNETANAAMLTTYGKMFSSFSLNSFNISRFTGLYGDELTNFDNGLDDIFQNNITSGSSSQAHGFFTAPYNIIYAANSIFEGCDQSNTLNPIVKKQIMGEALFLRAYWHFYLVNIYGDVPLALTTDYRINTTLFRSPVAEVYAQIIKDLVAAQNLLNENYTGIDGITTSPERVRANKSAATALLARVYLFSGDYTNAEKLSASLIANSSVYSLVPVAQVFQKNNKEAIWQIMPTNNPSYNTQEGFGYTVTDIPANQGKAILSNQQLAAFEKGDLRRSNWVGKYTDVATTTDYYFPAKYHDLPGSSISEYSVALRLAEQYLIHAEAKNELNDQAGAIADLNALRTRSRGAMSLDTPNPLPALPITLSKDQIKTAILHERQVELFSEYGHRWFDLKRTKNVDAFMTVVAPLKGGSWSTYKGLWPIPQTELLNNPNLKQNSNY